MGKLKFEEELNGSLEVMKAAVNNVLYFSDLIKYVAERYNLAHKECTPARTDSALRGLAAALLYTGEVLLETLPPDDQRAVEHTVEVLCSRGRPDRLRTVVSEPPMSPSPKGPAS